MSLWIVYQPDTFEVVKIAHTIKSAKLTHKCKKNPTYTDYSYFGLDKTDNIEQWKTFKLLCKNHSEWYGDVS